MTLALTILGLLARYLPLAIAAVEAGVADFDSVHAAASRMQAAALNPSEADRVAAEAEIAKLEGLLDTARPPAS